MGWKPKAPKAVSRAVGDTKKAVGKAAPVARAATNIMTGGMVGAAGDLAKGDVYAAGRNIMTGGGSGALGAAGSLMGKGNKSGGGAPPGAGDDNWWKEGQPDRQSLAGADGLMKENLQAKATPSRLGELDQRMAGAAPVNFMNQGNAAAVDNLGRLNNQAWDTNLSQAAQAQNTLVDNNLSKQIDRNNNANNGALLNARSDLSASGGMNSGARERLGMNGMRTRMMANANAYGDNTDAKMRIAANDFSQKADLQKAMPGMWQNLGRDQVNVDSTNNDMAMKKANLWQNQAGVEDSRNMNVQQFNINNAISEHDKQFGSKFDTWKEKNAAIAGQKTANAQNYYADKAANRGLLGNNGGILGTGLGFGG